MARYSSRHRDPRAGAKVPRAHWALLLFAMLALLAELALGGIVNGVGGEGGAPRAAATGPAAPKAVRGGGPVLRIEAGSDVATRHLPPGTVALTFDDGPDPRWTPQILDQLARAQARATFFVVGSKVNRYPELTRRILAEGHEIGIHTFTHADLAAVPAWRRRAEIALSQNALAGATGQLAVLMRPPFSSHPDAMSADDFAALRDVAGAGLLVVLADRDTQDWRRPGVDAIVAGALPPAGRGGVVMLHDSGGDRSQTVAALGPLLDRLKGHGYQLTTVSEALALPPPAVAGPGDRLRGDTLRAAQTLSGWLNHAMTALLGTALALGLLRLVLQLATARAHRRRARRQRHRPVFLGPVTVIVPAYNEAANIEATVRSLVASDYPEVYVLVVDDGSADDTFRIVRDLRLPRVRVIRQDNAGKPAALNNGLAHTHTDLVIMVDGDTIFERDAVGRLVQPFRDPEVGAVSGNAKVANRGGLLGRWQHLEYVMGFNLDRRMFDIGRCMPTVPGAIGAFRRGVLMGAGGVSSATLAEDTDLTMSVIRAGWRVVYEEKAIAWTEAPSTLRQLWRQRYRWCYGTMQAMWKHRDTLTRRGPAGQLGRRGLTYLTVFQVLLPLAAPAVDVYAIYGLLFLPLAQVAVPWLAFTALGALTAAYALRLDGERLRVLWSLPLQQFVYRQLMYLVVVQSVVTALAGVRLPWHRMVRSGAAQSLLRARTR
ncbi:bifunctional polysaccharide deacetylase/glycosyltransferase family 2 protein [Luedemannella helvata]|uniref:Glycosyltransferase n=1 Tax=Luedemannella helvata TaxID=349315 RepID=A0ABP4X5M5_9ACTN